MIPSGEFREQCLEMFTVYHNTADYPGEFVIRRWIIGRDNQPRARELVGRGMTLDYVRTLLPKGLFNVGRQTFDDPCIVETWL